jgi:hypothetical protein
MFLAAAPISSETRSPNHACLMRGGPISLMCAQVGKGTLPAVSSLYTAQLGTPFPVEGVGKPIGV